MCSKLKTILNEKCGLGAYMLNRTLSDNMAELMAQADLALGAGGAITWERLCLGLPSLVFSLAENQIPVCRDLHKMGLIEWIGDIKKINTDEIVSAIDRTMSREDIGGWSQRCMESFSDQGVISVVEAMLSPC